MENGELIAIGLGIFGSTTIHLSQGLMKLGIVRRSIRSGGKYSQVFIAGILLNLTAPLWVIVANRYAPTIYFTSMYATGLIALLWFSHLKLGEPMKAAHIAGAILLTAGAAWVAIEQSASIQIPMYQLESSTLLITGGLWLLCAPLLALTMQRLSHVRPDLVFGLLGGGFLAFDSILKGIAQASPIGSTFLPQSSNAWWLFAISFIGAIGALAMTQWAHYNEYRASVVIAGYDLAYVGIPILIVPIAACQMSLNISTSSGLILMTWGIWLITSNNDA